MMIKRNHALAFMLALLLGGLHASAQTRPSTRPTTLGAQSGPAIVFDNTPPVNPDLPPMELLDACLKSPRVMVINPPADRDPYGDLNIAERIQKQVELLQAGGATLLLYPDGQPAVYHTAGSAQHDRLAEFRSPAVAMHPGSLRQWYPDGTLMLAEDTTADGLQTARYLSPRGESLGKIEKGNGTAFIMETFVAAHRPGAITGTRVYKNGKLDGPAITFADYVSGRKQRQATYSAGLLDGPTLQWASDGWLNSAEIYHAGVKQEEFQFTETGRLTHSSHFSDRLRSTGPAENTFDPAPYRQAAPPPPRLARASSSLAICMKPGPRPMSVFRHHTPLLKPPPAPRLHATHHLNLYICGRQPTRSGASAPATASPP